MPASREPWRSRKPRSARPESARVNPPRPDPSLTAEIRSQSAGDRMIHRFVEGALGEMDGVYSSWSTDEPEGFDEPQLALLRQLLPTLALALKCVSLGRVAE